MQPVLTLTQQPPSFYPKSPTHARKTDVLQTTPKLPKRERLASFSRLVGSENFLELLPEECKGRRLRKLIGKDCSLRSPPAIRISTTSPHHQELVSENDTCLITTGKGSSDSNLLPFSPNFLNCKSPNYFSPNYQRPTPTKSPLYNATERQSSFLGRGSFGNVTLHVYNGSKFALKVSHQNGSSAGEKNFLKIRHPHLVTILRVAQIQDKVFICMNFAGHCNLQQVLDTKSELDFRRRLSFCIQIISGLRHCHQLHIVHGDVKPANVIVSPYGICKLGDFGHSISLDSGPAEKDPLLTEEMVGTVAYAAPEVLRCARPTLASDMYSFGILLWQVQTREFPFAGEHPHVIIYKVAHYGCRLTFPSDGDSVSRSFSEIATLCWCEEPSKRLNASHALKALQEIMQSMKLMSEKITIP